MPKRTYRERLRATGLQEAGLKMGPALAGGQGLGTRMRQLRILLADDTADNRLLIVAYFKRLSFHIDVAENGRVAVEKFTASGAYDLVLMDLQMPEMDGFTAARTIRASERAAHRARTPILALSAAVLDDDVSRALEAGCDALMSKPVSRSALLAKIEELLSGAEAPCAPSVAAASPSNDGTNSDHRFSR